jgi:hypothetical protein
VEIIWQGSGWGALPFEAYPFCVTEFFSRSRIPLTDSLQRSVNGRVDEWRRIGERMFHES